MTADHHADSDSEMTFDEKLIKMLNHWLKHNEDHAESYRNWAEKAKSKDLIEAGILLQDAAEISISINEKFEKALALFKAE